MPTELMVQPATGRAIVSVPPGVRPVHRGAPGATMWALALVIGLLVTLVGFCCCAGDSSPVSSLRHDEALSTSLPSSAPSVDAASLTHLSPQTADVPGHEADDCGPTLNTAATVPDAGSVPSPTAADSVPQNRRSAAYGPGVAVFTTTAAAARRTSEFHLLCVMRT